MAYFEKETGRTSRRRKTAARTGEPTFLASQAGKWCTRKTKTLEYLQMLRMGIMALSASTISASKSGALVALSDLS